jgi:hypothetical protein
LLRHHALVSHARLAARAALIVPAAAHRRQRRAHRRPRGGRCGRRRGRRRGRGGGVRGRGRPRTRLARAWRHVGGRPGRLGLGALLLVLLLRRFDWIGQGREEASTEGEGKGGDPEERDARDAQERGTDAVHAPSFSSGRATCRARSDGAGGASRSPVGVRNGPGIT